MKRIALLVLAVLAIPAAAQLRKAGPPTDLQKAPPARELPRATPTPSPEAHSVALEISLPQGRGGVKRDPIGSPALPCDPAAFAVAWQAFIDSPAPMPAAPACDPGWPHPSLLCASLQRTADRAAEEVAEQEYRRRLNEANAHAARCR